MVVSFKISRIGSRYRPKPKPEPEPDPGSVQELENEEVDAPEPRADAQAPNIRSQTAQKRSGDILADYLEMVWREELVYHVEDDDNVAENSDTEVSFILNIFTDGYTIVNPNESNVGNHVQDDPKLLRPYDRRSESLITAVECGYLPTDFLDDIPCKYINGTIICEVRDYRKESCEPAVNDSYLAALPSITRQTLKMSLNNVVKDIHLIADDTWGYGDLLEAEARILLALQPKLYLDPTPNLDMLCKEPTSVKLNLDIRGKRLKRLRQESAPKNPGSSVTNPIHVMDEPDLVNLVDKNVGQSDTVATGPELHAPEDSNLSVRGSMQVSSDPEMVDLIERIFGQSNVVATGPKIRAPEKLNSSVRDSRQATGDLASLFENNAGPSNMNMVANGPTWPKIHAPESSNSSVRDWRQVTGQPDFINLVDKNAGHRNMVSTEPKIYAPVDMKPITGPPGFVNLVDQNVGQSKMMSTVPQNHAPHTAVSLVTNQWSLQFGVGNLLNMQGHVNAVNDINSSSIMSSVNNQKGKNWQLPPKVNSNKRGRPTNVGRGGTNTNARKPLSKDSQVQQPLPIQFTRANFHKAPWNNMSPKREDDTLGKGSSSGLGGLQFGEGVTSVPVVSENRSLTFSANESMQQANWRSDTLLKAPVISGLGSSSSVGNILGPFSDPVTSVPEVSETVSLTLSANESMQQANWRSNILPKAPLTSGLGSSSSVDDILDLFSDPVDESMLDRFQKIIMFTARFKLDCKKNKINDEHKPTITFPKEQLEHVLFLNDVLFDDHNNDIPGDETCNMPLSTSLMGGNINICKTRVLHFVKDEQFLLSEDEFLEIPELQTRLMLSERQSDGTVAMHLGELDDVDYLADDLLLPTLPNTHKADLLAAQFCSLMLHDGYTLEGDYLEPKPDIMVQSKGGQPQPEDFNGWLQQVLNSEPSESFYGVGEGPISGSSLHNIHLQNMTLHSIGLYPWGLPPQDKKQESNSHLQNQLLQPQELSHIQTKTTAGHSTGGYNNNSTVLALEAPKQGKGHSTGGYNNNRTVLALAAPKGMGQSEANGSGRHNVGQSSNFGGLQVAKRQTHLGSSGVGSSSGSGLGMGQNSNFGGSQDVKRETSLGSSLGSWSGMGQNEANGLGIQVQNSNFGANRQTHLGSSLGSGLGIGQNEANGSGRQGQNSNFGANRQTHLGSSLGSWSGTSQSEANGPARQGQNSNFSANRQTHLGSSLGSWSRMGQSEANGPGIQGQYSNFGGLQSANRQTHLGSSLGSWSRMGQSEANGPGIQGQNSIFGGLQSANRQTHLGSSSGSGWGMGQSEANGLGRHFVGQNSNFGGLQGAIGQTHLGSRSGLWSGMGQNEANGPGSHVGQNSNFDGLQGAYRQTHLGTSGVGSGTGSGSGGGLRLGGAGGVVDRAINDMNPMQRNSYMNQQQFPITRQEPTLNVWPLRFPSQQAGSRLPPRAPSSGRAHKQVGPRWPTQ